MQKIKKKMTDKVNRLPLKGGKMKKVYVPYRYNYIITYNYTKYNHQRVKNEHQNKGFFVKNAQKQFFNEIYSQCCDTIDG